MKLLGLFVFVAMASSQAAQLDIRNLSCSLPQLGREAKAYLVSWQKSNGKALDKQQCLQTEIQKQSSVANNEAERFVVWNILTDVISAMDQMDMAAQVKCESTNTPGCGEYPKMSEELMKDNSQTESDILDREADLKNEDIKKQRQNEGRDW